MSFFFTHQLRSAWLPWSIRTLCACVCVTPCLLRSHRAGYDSPGSVLISPVPHQMMSYMNMSSLSRTELQLLNQLHCRRKRRHRTIFTDEQLEALEGLFQETKYPDVGTREQLARKVHLREEKVEVSAASCVLSWTLPVLIVLRSSTDRTDRAALILQLWILLETQRPVHIIIIIIIIIVIIIVRIIAVNFIIKNNIVYYNHY